MYKSVNLMLYIILLSSTLFCQKYWKHVEITKGGNIRKVVKSPDNSTLYAIAECAFSGGLYKSTNNGPDWERIEYNFLNYVKISDIAIDEEGNVLVGTSQRGLCLYNKSSNSWEKLYSPYSSNLKFVHFLPNNGILDLTSNFINYSPDKGVNWSAHELPSYPTIVKVDSEDNIYIGTSTGLFWTDNYGSTLHQFKGIPNSYITALCLINSEKILVGCSTGDWYYSEDSGDNWVKREYEDYLPICNIQKLSNGDLLAHSTAYFYKSTNGGESWNKVGPDHIQSLYEINNYTMLNDNIIIAGSENGIFISYDQGRTLTRTLDNIYLTRINGIASSPEMTISHINKYQYLYHENNSQNWELHEYNYVPINPTNFYYYNNLFYSTSYKGISYSADGVNWFTNGNTSDNDKSMNFLAIGTNYFHTKTGKLYKSLNSGAEWTEITLPESDYVSKFCLDSNNRIFCCGKFNLFFSDDMGSSWSSEQLPIGYELNPLELAATRENNIYLLTDLGLLFYNTDENYWTNLTNNLKEYVQQFTFIPGGNVFEYISSMLYDQKTQSLIVGMSYDESLANEIAVAFLSMDEGVTWQNISSGLESNANNKLSMDSTGTIYMATDGYGLFQSEFKLKSLTISPEFIDFGDVEFGKCDTIDFMINNSGYGDITIGDVICNDESFTIIRNTDYVRQDSSRTWRLVFSGLTEGVHESKVIFSSNDTGGEDTLHVSANCIASHFTTIDTLYFSPTYQNSVGLGELDLFNDGDNILQIDSVSIVNDVFDLLDFNKTVTINETVKIPINFTPNSLKSFSGMAIFYSNAITSPDTIYLYGEAAYSYLTYNSTRISFDSLFWGQTGKYELILSDSGNIDLEITSIVSSNSLLQIGEYNSITPVGTTQNMSLTFTPDSLRDYSEFIEIISSSISSPDTIYIEWLAQFAQLVLKEDSFDFGNIVMSNEKDTIITIKNSGISNLEVNCTFLKNKFSVSKTEFLLAPDDSMNLEIYFLASSPGELRDTLVFTGNSFSSPDSVFLHVNVLDPSSIIDNIQVPKEFNLEQNFPNPFNPTTTIKYSLPERRHVSLMIYDILGNIISTLVNETLPPGYYSIKFHANDLPSGIYFYRIISGKYVKTKKLILIK